MTRTQDHYGTDGIVGRILAAVPWSPDDGDPLTAPQLYPFDQLHGRELLATRDHAQTLAPEPGAQVLDIGAGIGGPARYLAATLGCRVTGIDLTPEFVSAASELSRLCGMEDRVRFVEGDAAHMPFADKAFDHACCFYVGMNLPDKPAVMAEAARVLKPGGRLIWTEAASAEGTEGAEPHYPLPWAREPAGSHLSTEAALRAALEAAGFSGISVTDETAAHLELARQRAAGGPPPAPGHAQANAVVMGADFMDRRRNYIRSLAEGRIASLVFLAERA